MAQALARIRLSDVVEPMDVDEALRLIDVSKSSLNDDSQRRGGRHDTSPMSGIFNIVREMSQERGEDSFALSAIRNRVASRGYTEAQFEEAIREYTGLDIWQVNDSRLHLIH